MERLIMKNLLFLFIALAFISCTAGVEENQETGQAEIVAVVTVTEETLLSLVGLIEPLKGPCFSGNLNVQPIKCDTDLKKIGSSTSYSLNGYDAIDYSQTQPTSCATVTGALSCYSEVTKTATVGTVDLAAYVDFSITPSFTVNVLTKIAGGCIAKNVADGFTISESATKAKDAFLLNLGLPADSTYQAFSELDFKNAEKKNEILIIVSAIVQKWGNDNGSEINAAVTALQNDFADCSLSNTNVGKLHLHANQIDYDTIVANLVQIYADNYSTAVIPAASTGLIDSFKDSDLDGVVDALDDDTADAWDFVNVLAGEPFTEYPSNLIILAGLGDIGTTKGSFSGGKLSYNSVDTTTDFNAKNGDSLRRVLMSQNFGTTTSGTLTIGETTKTYSVTTRMPKIGMISGLGSKSSTGSMGSLYLASPFIAASSFSAKYAGFDGSCVSDKISIYSDNSGKPSAELATGTMQAAFFFGDSLYDIIGGGSSKLQIATASFNPRFDIVEGVKYWVVASKSASCYISTYETSTAGQAMFSNDLSNWVAWGAGVNKTFLTD
jgi:hypothetical protein